MAKLVRRHPHVFADPRASEADRPSTTPEHVEANWDRIKTAEKGRESVLDGIPVALPALARADAVLGRLDRAGLSAGRRPEAADAEQGWDEARVGGTLLAVVEQARSAGVDAEAALRSAVRRLEADARRAEQREGAR